MKKNKITLGIDIGSTTSKCVIMCDGSDIITKQIVSAGIGTSGPDRAIGKALTESGLDMQEIHRIVSTGYGRNSFQQADFQLSELTCHAKGARFLFNNARTVIDIGGRSKVLQLSEAAGF
jgi:predicted CoA-substrate-specific enzyme activase